jgi:flagellar biosynthesis chaperone FliJ
MTWIPVNFALTKVSVTELKKNNMKALQKLMQEVLKLTTKIETEYPELYKYLDETPMNVGKHPEKDVTIADLKNYLQTLREQLEEHIKTHRKSTKP